MSQTQAVLERSPPSNTKRIDTAAPKRPFPKTRNDAGAGCGCVGVMLLLALITIAAYFYFR